jgi:uroporphyrinogen-III decarboxylase
MYASPRTPRTAILSEGQGKKRAEHRKKPRILQATVRMKTSPRTPRTAIRAREKEKKGDGSFFGEIEPSSFCLTLDSAIGYQYAVSEETPRERMRRAMALGAPGRVPVMCQMSIGHMLLQTGFPPAEFWFERDCFVEGLVRLRELYAFDGILVSLHGHRDGWSRKIRSWRREDSGREILWTDGSRTIFPPDDLPMHFAAADEAAPSIESFFPEAIPERLDYIPVSQGLRFAIDPDRPYDSLRRVLDRAEGRYSVHGEVTSPLDYFLDLFGFAPGFMALADEPERSRAVLDVFADRIARIASEQAALGADAIKISSPYAGAGFISPGHYRTFVLPYEARIAAAARAAGAFVYTHTCGAIGDRLELMAEAGVSGLECLDPPPLGNVDLAEAKARIGRRLFIKGNIDPVNTLLRGTLGEVEEDVRARLAVGTPGGGFILSTACSIAPHTPRPHIQALARLAK